MTIQRWHWLCAGVVFGGSLAGAANAQQVVTSSTQAITPAFAPPPYCAPGMPRTTFWQRSKARRESWCDHGPDPVPLGQFLYENMSTQIDRGVAVRMILHDYDFLPGGAELNVRGHDVLLHIANLAMKYPYHVVVERTTTNPILGEMRRMAVLNELGRHGIPLPAERVVVGAPLTRGLYGVEANIIYHNLLLQTSAAGASIQGPGGGASTTGTSSGAPTGTTGTSSGSGSGSGLGNR